jgi:hypothetical protein
MLVCRSKRPDARGRTTTLVGGDDLSGDPLTTADAYKVEAQSKPLRRTSNDPYD